jgi:capsular exopolysaccharide synthesis family protein
MPTKDLAGSMNFLTGEGTVAALLATKQTMEMELNALTRASLGPSHPDVVRIRAMVDELDAKIDEGVNTVKRAMRLEYERSQAELDGLAEKLAELKEQERKLSASGVAEYERARTDLSVMNARGAFLEDRLAKEMLTLKLPSTSVQLLEEAKVNPNDPPVSPNFALNVMLSLFAGLFFGVVLAFFVEYLDTSVKTVDDIEKHLAASVLGIIPQKIRHLNDPSARPGHSEPYRVLRTNIKSSKTLADGKVISVTSSSAGEGKTQTLFNLAYVSADVGDRVLLIDSDLHRPRLHKVLDMDNDRGLCNVIVGEVSIEEAIRETDNPNLHFLPSGRLSSASVHGLLDTEEMTNIIKELSPHYDRIFLDSPPIVGVSDAVQLARMVDGVILVVQHRKYPRTLAKRASEMIVNMGGNLIGVVLNNINVSRDYSSYYYKHQYYYYSYGYTTPGKS